MANYNNLDMVLIPHFQLEQLYDQIEAARHQSIDEYVKNNPYNLKFLDPVRSRDIIICALKYNGLFVEYLPTILKKDEEIGLIAVKQNYKAIFKLDKSLRKNRNIVLAEVKQNGLILFKLDEEFKHDRDIVLAAVKQNAYVLLDLDEEFKNDREMVLEAVKRNESILLRLDSKFWHNPEILMTAINRNPEILNSLDKESILIAVKINGLLIQLLNEKYINDITILEEAIKQNKEAIKYLNKENTIYFLQKDGLLFEYINKEYIQDFDIQITAVRQNYKVLEIFDKYRVEHKIEFIKEGINQNVEALKYIVCRDLKTIPTLLDYLISLLEKDVMIFKLLNYYVQDYFYEYHKDILLKIVRQNGLAIQALNDFYDDEIIIAALQQNIKVFNLLSKENKIRDNIIVEVIKINLENIKLYSLDDIMSFKQKIKIQLRILIINYLNENKIIKDKELVIRLHLLYPDIINYVDKCLYNDFDIMNILVKHNGMLLKSTSKELKNNKIICLNAVKQNGLALKYVGEELCNDEDIIREALKNDFASIEYAKNTDSKLWPDDEIVMEYVSKFTKKVDILRLIKYNVLLIKYVDERFHDKEIGMAVVKENCYALFLLNPILFNCKEIVYEALKQDRLILINEFNSYKFDYFRNVLKDPLIAEIALYVDIDRAIEIVKQDGLLLKGFMDRATYLYYYNSEEKRYMLYLNAVKQNGLAIKYVNPNTENYIQIAVAAVLNNEKALDYVEGFALKEVKEELNKLKQTQFQKCLK